jgi:hypothetical protein
MGLTQPVVLGTVGPTYATEINGDLLTIDQHDHSSGKGVQVTQAGLNITGDLSYHTHSATALHSAGFTDQATPSLSGLNLYFSGGEIFAATNFGNVQLTLNGSVNTGASGNISGLTSPASASYSSITKTFTWQQDTNKAAHMNMANAIIARGATTSENTWTLTPSATLASSLTMTFPDAYPGSTLPMAMSSAGVLSFPATAPTNYVNTAAIVDANVTTAKIADGAVTLAKQTQPAVSALSSSCSGFSQGNTSNAWVNVTNLSVTITASGLRPIAVFARPDGTSGAGINLFNAATGNSFGFRVAVSGATTENHDITLLNSVSSLSEYKAPNLYNTVIVSPAAGSTTVTLQVRTNNAGSSVSVAFVKLFVCEL